MVNPQTAKIRIFREGVKCPKAAYSSPVPEPAEWPRCDLRGTGEFICLTIYLNDGTEIDGHISFDNFDLVFERLPIALQDPDNVDFYLPGFYLFGKDE